MPQVNTLAIDIAPSKDFSPVQSGTSSSSKNSNKDFSQVIEQHYQSQQSGKKQESSGNKSKLDNAPMSEKNNVDSKSSPTSVQPKENETDTVSDEDIKAETEGDANTGERLIIAKTNNESTTQQENHQQDTGGKKAVEVININNESPASIKLDDSTEQLMSFLSASQKILADDGNSEAAVAPQTNEKLQAVNGGTKPKEITELEALLKQVLGKNDEKKAENASNNSTEVKSDKHSTEQLKAAESTKAEQLLKTVSTDSKPSLDSQSQSAGKAIAETKTQEESKQFAQADKVIKADSKAELAALMTNKAENKQISTVKPTDPASEQLKPKDSGVKAEQVTDNHKYVAKQSITAADIEAMLTHEENSAAKIELEKIKAELLGSHDKARAVEKGTQENVKTEGSVSKISLDTESLTSSQNKAMLNDANLNKEAENANIDKVAFAGVSIPGEKQAQEGNQNHSRVINQSTQSVIEQQSAAAGEQSQEQSLDQEKQKQSQSLATDEKLAKSEVQLKEKPFSELFDKKLMNSNIESALNRDVHQVNEATKSAASAEEMITKLSSENVQSTAQSVSNAKQVASLQNEALSVYRKDFTGALKDKVMVMMNQRLQQVEIRLDPQELGNVNVKINLQNDQAIVNFTVQNQQAKEAFDQNLGRLKDMLAESGVDVGDANVEQQNKQSDGEEFDDNQAQGEGDVTGNDFSELTDTETMNLIKGSSTGVDYYA